MTHLCHLNHQIMVVFYFKIIFFYYFFTKKPGLFCFGSFPWGLFSGDRRPRYFKRGQKNKKVANNLCQKNWILLFDKLNTNNFQNFIGLK